MMSDITQENCLINDQLLIPGYVALLSNGVLGTVTKRFVWTYIYILNKYIYFYHDTLSCSNTISLTFLHINSIPQNV